MPASPSSVETPTEGSNTPTPTPALEPSELAILVPEAQLAGDGVHSIGLGYDSTHRRLLFTHYADEAIYSISPDGEARLTERFDVPWGLDDGDLKVDPEGGVWVLLDDDDNGLGADSLLFYPLVDGAQGEPPPLWLYGGRASDDDTEDPRGLALSAQTGLAYVRMCAGAPPVENEQCSPEAVEIWQIELGGHGVRRLTSAQQVLEETGEEIESALGMDIHPQSGRLITATWSRKLVAIDPSTGEASIWLDLSPWIGPGVAGITFTPEGDLAVMAALFSDTTYRVIHLFDLTGDLAFGRE